MTEMTPRAAVWKEALDEARSSAREQIEAAWQLHVDRVGEELARGWREHIAQIVEERFGELSARLEATLDEAVARERIAARRQAASDINQAARLMRQAEGRQEQARALVEGAQRFCARAALFSVEGVTLRLEPEGGLAVPVAAAPAFAAAIETPDPVAAVFSASELSPAVAAHFGPAAGQRVYLFPVAMDGRAIAVLYAEGGGDGVDANAIEALCAIAATVLAPRSMPSDLVNIAPPVVEPSWANLPAEERELHRKAQRFARVRVAEMRLYQSKQVKEGRRARDLYGALSEEIRKAREEYRAAFVEPASSMVDYFHIELVRTLVNDDATLLGAGYPGPLV
jgi:hypothetical protein